MNSNKKKIIISRTMALILALVPFVYFEDFYEHFYVYLTGTIITDVIVDQWHIVFISIAVSIAFFFLLSFRRKVKWIEYGAVSAFFVSLFVEMYGIPLTIILASEYFFRSGARVPRSILEFNFLGVGFGADVAMVYGMILIVIGMSFIFIGWITLYKDAKKKGIASGGIYSFSRHPQYLGFILMITGWLFGWPTILTAVFVPVLVYKYIRLCETEEEEILNQNPEYKEYKETAPFLL